MTNERLTHRLPPREEVLDSHLAYWKQQLQGVPDLLELPTDHPRLAIQTFHGARQVFPLSQALTEQLKALSQREEATLFTTLLAAFQVLLFRYTGQYDLVVGTPISNRTPNGIEKLIDLCTNTLVLRTDLSGDPSFRELLGRVREVIVSACAHQHLPFEELAEELALKQGSSRNPLFQVLFALRDAPVEVPELSVPRLRPQEVIYKENAELDLTLTLWDTSEGLMGCFDCNADLFDATTIARIIEHYQTLLKSIVASPGQRLSELPILAETERQLMLMEWNATASDYSRDTCIHELFEAQVEQTPEAIALVWGENQLTYRELNQRANQLAHYLQTRGVGPETLVGLCVERSLEMIVGLLGILKAGGAYVPLDPAYPQERLAFMLQDARVPVLLTQQMLLARLPEYNASVVCLDIERDSLARESQENLSSGVSTQNLAYVIYTSGSTGRPKGVQIEHRGLYNLAKAQVHIFGIAPGDRVLQFASLNFDASISEIVMSLSAGAVLVLADRESLQPGMTLIRLFRDQGITTVTLAPSVLAALPVAALPTLQTIIVAGEACPAELAARWGAERQFFNAYGPTEATVCATVAACSNSSPRLPIGRPIANTQIYVLDSYLQPVPIGVPGEIYLGGVGLARGYLNRPDLTADRFLAQPFTSEPGAQLYKTGDRGRYLPGGTIEFLGRSDQQVKLRGFRIELGEIEAVLVSHPAVREAVVAVHDHPAGDRRLVAYIVTDEEQTVTNSELRAHLKKRVPEYMVPSLFVPLGALPLTSNNKIDRSALPLPASFQQEVGEAYEAPQTELEHTIAAVVQEVLQVEQIGIHDNFFELGGHSLLAAKIQNDLEAVIDRSIAVIDLFEHPTISSLAEYLSWQQDKGLSFEHRSLQAEYNGS